MAIYRRSSRRPLVIVGIVAAIVGIVLGYAAGRATAPDLTSQIAAARADAAPLLTSLDVIQTEYPKLLASTPGSDPGGAPSALALAQSTFASHRAEFQTVDPADTAALSDALDKLSSAISARAAATDVNAAVATAETAAMRLAGTAAAT